MLKKEVQGLFPGYFALVMATGIISIGAHLSGLDSIAHLLFIANNIFLLVLSAAFVLRVAIYFPNVKNDLRSPESGAGFFTLVAAFAQIGLQYLLLKERSAIAAVFFFIALVLWMIVIYSFFFATMIRKEKPPIEKSINGSWLIAAVATQSLAILAAQLSENYFTDKQSSLLFSMMMFLLGGFLYVLLIGLLTYRLFFFPLKPEVFKPSYWVMMGGAAISCVSACVMLQQITAGNFSELTTAIKVVALLSWGIASFWIPLLVLLEGWKYLINKSPLEYTAEWWSLVFTLGMYTVASAKLSEAIQSPFFHSLASIFIYIAFFAWLVVMLAMLMNILRTFSPGREESPASDNQPLR